MKKIFSTRLILLVVFVLFMLSFNFTFIGKPLSSYAAKTIQYKVVSLRTCNAKAVETMLNEFGNGGWELINHPCDGGAGAGNFIFKK